ncbi:MAG: hypothetical protein K8I00_01345 [Candidatus Omnitrophica bacterium]|nr:hypothetical protein [Candidatus Omnitrophota bacterium]
MTKKYLWLKLLIPVFLYVAVDYSSYIYTTHWFKKLQNDLPIGTPLVKARKYLIEEGSRHHISHLTEDWRESETRGFVFKYHFDGIITPHLMRESGDGLESFVAVRFDKNDKIKEIYRMK